MHNRGFSGIEIVLVVFVIAIIGFGSFLFFSQDNREDKQPSEASKQSPILTETPKSDDLVLYNLGLQNISPQTNTQGIASDLTISMDALREYKRGLKGFYLFGEPLEGNRLNPTFEYASVREGAKVIAAANGVITFIREQPETNDMEVFLQPVENSQWMIGYDHITNVAVQKGDRVTVGSIIGEASRQNNGLLRFEIQVNKEQNNQTTHVCPTTLLADEVKESVITDLLAMQLEWETMSGIQTLYDTQAQSPVGCLKETLTVQESEGR